MHTATAEINCSFSSQDKGDGSIESDEESVQSADLLNMGRVEGDSDEEVGCAFDYYAIYFRFID